MNDLPRTGEHGVKNRVNFVDSLFAYAYPLHPVLRFVIDTAVIIACADAIFLLQEHRFADPELLVCLAATYVCIVLACRFIIFWRNRDAYNQVLTISPTAIRCLPEKGANATVQWSAVKSICKKFGAIIVKVSEKPSTYYWINKRSFSSKGQSEEFFQHALAYFQAAHSRSGTASDAGATDVTSFETEQPTHSLTTSLTLRELLIGNWLVKQKLILILLTVLFAATALQLVTTGFKIYALDIALNAAALLVILAWVPWLSWKSYHDHPERMHGTVSICPRHLRTTGAGFDTYTPWSQVREVSRTGDLLIFTLDRQLALVIPTRAFASREESENFYRAAFSYHKKNKPSDTV